jgi:asparagine synthase (glutamine-hydrolysing)
MLPGAVGGLLSGDKIHKAAGVVGLGTPDDIYASLISLWQRPEAIVIGAAEPASLGDTPGLPQSDPVRRMMFLDLVTYLPDDILVKVDRASMAVGLEGRVPLLDHRLVEFSWRLPLSILRRDGVSKWPLRRVLERYVPRALTERPKMGFGVPIDSWLRGALRDWAESLLDERRLAREGILQSTPIRAAWKAHLEGSRNFQYQLWTVLMFEAWHEQERAGSVRRPAAALAAGS